MKPKINPRATRIFAALPGWALIATGLMIDLATLVWAGPGDVDLTFNAGSTMRGYVAVFVPLPDGKVLIGGEFEYVSGAIRSGLARFQADGTLDQAFNPASGNYSFAAVSEGMPGKVMVAGADALGRNGIWRLNADGSHDPTFATPVPMNHVLPFILQRDGKILAMSASSGSRLMRLNVDGGIDPTFTEPVLGPSQYIFSLALQRDGRILIGGSFTAINGITRSKIARLHEDGTLDPSFVPETGPNDPIWALVVAPDGKMIIGFGTYFALSLKRLNANGSLDRTFAAPAVLHEIFALAFQRDGRLLVAGGGVERLNLDGGLDATFAPGPELNQAEPLLDNSQVLAMAVQADDKIFVSATLGGVGFARLNADGARDHSFRREATGPNGPLTGSAVQPDGKVVVTGEFTAIGGISRNGIARLNADGSLDPSFNPGVDFDGWGRVTAMTLQADGRIVVGGHSFVNGMIRFDLVRLNSNGSLDPSFSTKTRQDFEIAFLAAQPDGKILNAVFEDGAAPWAVLTRLNADGSLDRGFTVASNHGVDISRIALQNDRKILIAGLSRSDPDHRRSAIARLNEDGSLDGAFHAVVGEVYYWGFNCVSLQSDGRILLSGLFYDENERLLTRIIRLHVDGSPDPTFDYVTPNSIVSIAPQLDGRSLVGSVFGDPRIEITGIVVRLNADGALDRAFRPATGIGGGIKGGIASVTALADGRALVRWNRGTIYGAPRTYLARLEGDPARLSIQQGNSQRILSWTNPAFALQAAPVVTGPYVTIPGATSPHTNAITGLEQYFRLKLD